MISHQEIAKQLFHSTTNNKTGKPVESIFGLVLELGPPQYFKRKMLLKNSKVFEQKGDLLNFKANIDPMAVLSQVKPG